MNDILTLKAEMREETGTGAARALRLKGMVPATVYGAGQKPMSVAIEEKEITKAYRKPQYISQLIELEIGKKKYKVLPKAIELHPTNELVRHADFVFLESKMQKMEVPLVYINKDNCIGIKRGGYFNIVKRSIMVSCPVKDLIRKIEINTTDMQISTSLKAKELNIPKGVTLLEDPEFVVASIIGKKGKTEVEESAETAEAGAEEKTA